MPHAYPTGLAPMELLQAYHSLDRCIFLKIADASTPIDRCLLLLLSQSGEGCSIRHDGTFLLTVEIVPTPGHLGGGYRLGRQLVSLQDEQIVRSGYI